MTCVCIAILPVQISFWHPWILIIIDVAPSESNFYCYEIKFGLEPPYKKQFLRISSWCCMLILTLFFMRFAISKGSFLLGSRKCQTIVSIWHSKKHKQVLNCVDSTFSAINYLLTMSFSYSSVLFTSMFWLLFVFDSSLQL